MFFHNTKVSVCIPLYGTEEFLQRCLESVASQDFKDLEVIVVDDCSPAKDGISGQEIAKRFKKSVKFPVTYLRHEQNKGLVEARRTAVYEAKGEYIIILDSDDQLTENAVSVLYKKAVETGADIVQGKAEVFFSDTSLDQIDSTDKVLTEFKNRMQKKVNNVFHGELLDNKILDGYMTDLNHNGILWGKIFKKETYLEALNHIPPVFCTMAEDVIQYFWLALCSKKYAGIDDVVYKYSINTGISSRTKIDSIERWEKVCSTASVFTAIYTELQRLEEEEGKKLLTDMQQSALNALCRFYLKNNLLQLKTAVVPELQEQAKAMLCDYWGADFVERIEKTSE